MSFAYEDLARRAVACDDWEPLPGMIGVLDGKQVVILRVIDGVPAYVDCWDDAPPFTSECVFLPLFTEASTLGCVGQLINDEYETAADVEALVEALEQRSMNKPMEASCECGGTITVRTDEGLGIIDYHCIKCGATAQTYEQDDGTLKLVLYQQYRRATDP